MRASGAVPARASSWRRPAVADLANQPWYFPTKDPRLIPTANSPRLTVLIGWRRHGLDADDKGGAGEWPEEGRSGRRERFGQGELAVNGSAHGCGLGRAAANGRHLVRQSRPQRFPGRFWVISAIMSDRFGTHWPFLANFGRVSHALGMPKKRHRDGWNFGANFI